MHPRVTISSMSEFGGRVRVLKFVVPALAGIQIANRPRSSFRLKAVLRTPCRLIHSAAPPRKTTRYEHGVHGDYVALGWKTDTALSPRSPNS